jgi:hypothetical protein
MERRDEIGLQLLLLVEVAATSDGGATSDASSGTVPILSSGRNAMGVPAFSQYLEKMVRLRPTNLRGGLGDSGNGDSLQGKSSLISEMELAREENEDADPSRRTRC